MLRLDSRQPLIRRLMWKSPTGVIELPLWSSLAQGTPLPLEMWVTSTGAD